MLHLVLTHIAVSVSWLQAFSQAGHYLHPLTMNILADSSREHSPSSQVNIRLTSLPQLSLFKLSLFPYKDLTLARSAPLTRSSLSDVSFGSSSSQIWLNTTLSLICVVVITLPPLSPALCSPSLSLAG